MKLGTKTQRLINPARKPLLFYTGVAISILFMSYCIVRSYYFSPHDFANSYFGAYFFLNGEFDLGIFDPYTFNKRIYDAGFRDVFVSFNPNPPSTALFFLIGALLPLSLSKLLFNIVCSALFLLSIDRLCKHLKLDPTWFFMLLPIVFFIPIRNQILFGQTYFLLVFLLVEGFIAYENKRLWLSALFWSVAIFLKVFPLIIVLFLMLRKEWRATGYLAVCGILMLTLCITLQGTDVWVYYFTQVLPRSNAGQVTAAYETNFQSALMFFKFLFVGNSQLNPQPLVDSAVLFAGSLILFKSIVLLLTISYIRSARPVLAFGLIFLTSILLLSYGNTYGNLVLIILLIGLSKELSLRKLAIVSLILFLICNAPLGLLRDLPPIMQFPRLILLIVMFAVVVLLLSHRIEWRFIAVILPLLALPEFVRDPDIHDPSILLVKDQQHSLVYNYEVKDDRIVYYYWTEQGESSFVTNVVTTENSSTDVELKEDQIFYKGKQVTFTPDNKKMPTRLNERYLLYLSDKDRGIGFYSLRVIDLKEIYRFDSPS